MHLLMSIAPCRHLPSLRCLSLARGTVSTDGLEDEGLRLLVAHSRDLEQLQFKEVPRIWSEVLKYTHLRELDVDISQFSQISSWDNIFKILDRSPELQSLKLAISQPPENEEFTASPEYPFGDTKLPSRIICYQLLRVELRMEFRHAVHFLDRVELPSMTKLDITSVCITARDVEPRWPFNNYLSLPSLKSFTCRHVLISDIVSFFVCFYCPSLCWLAIYPTVVSTQSPGTVTGSPLSPLNPARSNGTKTKLFGGLKKKKAQPVERGRTQPVTYSSQLPALESLHLYAIFPETTVEFLSEVDMPKLKELDVSSYNSLHCARYDDALRFCQPKPPLPSLSTLTIDSLDQCCLLRHWTGDRSKWHHLQVQDRQGDARIHWIKFCAHHRDILSEVQALSIKVNAYWLTVPDPFGCFTWLMSLTLEFESHSYGLFQSLLMSDDDLKGKMTLPSLRALYIKNSDLDVLDCLREFILRRQEARKPLKLLYLQPFPGKPREIEWFERHVSQFDFEWPAGRQSDSESDYY